MPLKPLLGGIWNQDLLVSGDTLEPIQDSVEEPKFKPGCKTMRPIYQIDKSTTGLKTNVPKISIPASPPKLNEEPVLVPEQAPKYSKYAKG